MQQRHILLAVTGGIAAYKVPELVRWLQRAGHRVRCVMTPAATEFVSPLVLQSLTGEDVRSQLLDAGEEGQIGHIALADWADQVVVAPATANTLAKLAHGMADDLVTAVALATRAPLLVAPAMNVNMWEHPATQDNIESLRSRGVRFVGPEAGELACGWEGVGRMSEPSEIGAAVDLSLAGESLSGEVVLVTAGGTRERVDAVRYLGNRSSGKMGFAIAEQAARRGARVVLVSGPTSLATPAGVRRLDVESALEMRDAVLAEWPDVTIAIKAAAVADFRPARASDLKIRKEDLADGEAPTLELVRNPDILAELCSDRGARIVVGFAAESHDVLESARRKLERKGCDLLVANDVRSTTTGFDSDMNRVSFIWPGGENEELPTMTKSEVAEQLFDRIEKLCEGRR
ncbi:bifunctional phosphopantothenoylcysteine decarboxylase/phosphopantothenate--cysteine ligase CoaBC [Myxococcota bacterium]|nr:bifunctional phosphopantothenoylcysteine decarboxylase/phosphopantothenate--cysteine ligase CoaBC [Myxococcota bacterium]